MQLMETRYRDGDFCQLPSMFIKRSNDLNKRVQGAWSSAASSPLFLTMLSCSMPLACYPLHVHHSPPHGWRRESLAHENVSLLSVHL